MQLDLRPLFSDNIPPIYNSERSGRIVCKLGFLSEAGLGSACHLCRCWSVARCGNDEKEYFFKQVKLGGISTHPAYAVLNEHAGNVFGDPWLQFSRPHTSSTVVHIRPRKRSVDFELVRSWLQTCEDHHVECMRKDRAHRSKIIGRLIDCYTGQLCAAPPEAKYTALSYVWGTNEAVDAPANSSAGISFPLVIRDAVSASKAMGYQYLWVDRYCIDQTNPRVKMHQIRNMDVIYEQADVTIISLGKNPSEGLPGVSTAPRVLQGCVRFTSGSLRSSLNCPHNEIRYNSKWWTRAWTLQEAVLSRRRLFFTESQAYFECCRMHQSEVISFEPIAEGETQVGFRGIWKTNVLNFSQEPHLWSIQLLLENYTARHLTYSSDALLAFLGILAKYTGSSQVLKHYFGLPIEISTLSSSMYHVDPESSLVDSFVNSLAWDNGPIPIRRSEFPSWTWVGWVTNYGRCHFYWKNKDLYIWIERPDGSAQSLMDFVNEGGLEWPTDQLTHFIWLEGLHADAEMLTISKADGEIQLQVALLCEPRYEGLKYILTASKGTYLCPVLTSYHDMESGRQYC